MKSILKIAEKNVEVIMPGFTHLKNAQAISFGHYLMAYIEMFNRDKKRNEFIEMELEKKVKSPKDSTISEIDLIWEKAKKILT